jgi:macrolide transport system ATP-binding/permease protein
MNSLGQNLRFAVRQLAHNPGFTATVIITLALSIGANTAIFSVVNALMLKSLPYPKPDRVGTLFEREQGPDPNDGIRWIDGTQWEHLRDNVPSLVSAVSSSLAAGANLEANHRIDYVHDGRISAHYFDVLGIRTALGRSFSQNGVTGPMR